MAILRDFEWNAAAFQEIPDLFSISHKKCQEQTSGKSSIDNKRPYTQRDTTIIST